MFVHVHLESLPEIGFAHHFHATNYEQAYGIRDSSFEILYIRSGKAVVTLKNEAMELPEGSVLFLFRELPIHFQSVDDIPHSHCSIQLRCTFSFSLLKEEDETPTQEGLLLPMMMPPSETTERIGRRMHTIVAELRRSRTTNMQRCTLAVLGLLAEADRNCREGLATAVPSDKLLADKVTEWIDSHLHEEVLLERLAAVVGRSPNYVNTVFKRANGRPIRQYINRKKALLMADLMRDKGINFRIACENVGISDVAYGYRLFKKQMGLTPGEYTAVVCGEEAPLVASAHSQPAK